MPRPISGGTLILSFLFHFLVGMPLGRQAAPPHLPGSPWHSSYRKGLINAGFFLVVGQFVMNWFTIMLQR